MTAIAKYPITVNANTPQLSQLKAQRATTNSLHGHVAKAMAEVQSKGL